MVSEIVALLEPHRNPGNAAPMEAYMKNQFPFLGIKKTVLDSAVKPYINGLKKQKQINWTFVSDLWKLPQREYQYVAMMILQVQKKQLIWEDLSKIEVLILQKSWWDTVDLMAGHLLGELGLKYPEKMSAAMLDWSTNDNIWIARSALLYQLKFKEKTHKDILATCILNNNESPEFFIRKAIGWILREYSKTNPQWVRDFINENTLSGLSVREGSKYL